MKKKVLSCAVALAISLGGLSTLPFEGVIDTAVTARAEETLTYGDFEYYINADNKAVITNYIGSSSTVNIPSEINGKPVLLEELGKTVVFNEDILYSTFSSNIEIINVPADAITPHSVSVIFDIPCLKEINVISDDSKEYGFFSKDGVLFEKTVQTYYDSVINDWVTRDIIVLSFYPMAKEDLEYTIPSNITLNAAIINKNIKKLNILKNTTPGGVINFNNCPNLCEINVESGNPYLFSIDGVLYGEVYSKKSVISCPRKKKSVTIPNDIENIEWIAFSNCDELTSIIIPDSVTSIGAAAFEGCDNLKEVKMGNNVSEIGLHAFSNCISLLEINLSQGPQNVQFFGETFKNCTSLTSVTLSKNLYAIVGDFYNCKKLKEIEIPKSVSKIFTDSFLNCMELKKVTILGTETEIEKEAIGYYWDLNTYSYKKVNGLVIYCYPNSTAEKYAKENGFDYVLLKPSTTDLKSCTVTADKTVFGYTGKAKAPTVTIKDGSYTLKQGTDYTLSYKNNKNIGTGTITVTGKGNYTGTKNLSFTIIPSNVGGFKAASTSASAVKLSWNKVNGAGGYIVYQYNTSTKKWVRIAKTGNVNTYTVKSLKAGTTYKYAIKAYKTVSGKDYTSAKYPTITTSTKPAKVSFKATAASKAVKFSWSKVAGATNYIVYYRVKGTSSWKSVKVANNVTSRTISGLVKGKTYEVTVKAVRTVNKVNYNGAYDVKTVKVK